MKLTNLFGKVLLVWMLLFCKAGFAQTSSSGQAAALPNGPNGKAIMGYYNAFEKKDWNLIQPFLADGFTFSSPVDDHISVKAFKERCWPNAGKIKSVDVQQLIMGGDVVFIISNGYNTDGKLLRNCDYFTIKDGKISAYECFFGPGINYPTSGK